MKKNIKKLILEYHNFMDDILDDPDAMVFSDISNITYLTPKTNKELREVIDHLLKAGHKNLNAIDISHITDFSKVFFHKNLKGVDISEWDVSHGIKFERMFDKASFLPDLSSWSLDSVQNAKYMF